LCCYDSWWSFTQQSSPLTLCCYDSWWSFTQQSSPLTLCCYDSCTTELNIQLAIMVGRHSVLPFCFRECHLLQVKYNGIGVMVNVLASSAVGRVLDPPSDQTKDYNIGICCFSAKHAALRRKSNQ
jgi:hypothetical protein